MLSKGTHKINGKTYYVKENLYDVVPKDMNQKDKFIIKDGKVHLDYDRQFLTKDDGPPKVDVTKPLLHKANTIAQTTWKEHPIVTFIALALLAIACILIVRSIIHLLFKRK